jgi:hypothetical protein
LAEPVTLVRSPTITKLEKGLVKGISITLLR